MYLQTRERRDIASIGEMVCVPVPGGDHLRVGTEGLPVDHLWYRRRSTKGHAHVTIHRGVKWRILQISIGSEWEYYVAQYRDLNFSLTLL